jgi:hypothetical protein
MILKVKRSLFACMALLLFCSVSLKAQVPVSEEPRHHNVFQNKYIRLLDVWLEPGDSTQYHIHATPSLFVQLSNTVIGTQIKGKEWVKDPAVAGRASYRSFSPEILVHRVCNLDTVPFHVNDIEILSGYNGNNVSRHDSLPFHLLFENERAFAWQVTHLPSGKQIIEGRGPVIAELVSGDEVVFHDVKTNQSTGIKAGKYLYIEPGSSFYFTAREISMVIFELK